MKPTGWRLGVSWLLRIVAAGTLLQTLYFKLTGAEESVWIFSQLGAEPWGRFATALAEFTAALLLLVPATAVYGAGFSIAIISGAIVSHLAVLGIEVQNDGGLLFGLAITVWLASAGVVYLHRGALPLVGPKYQPVRH